MNAPICKHCYTNAYMIQLNLTAASLSVEVKGMNKHIDLFCCANCGTVHIDSQSQKLFKHRLHPYELADEE